MSLCQICQSIDWATVLAKPISKLFNFAETYPLNHNLFHYVTRYEGLQHPVDGLVLYHKNIVSLRASAVSCKICCLVQDQVDKRLRNGEAAAKLGFKYPESFELWICGTGLSGFFQVLGYNKADTEKRFVKSAAYELLAGFGICVEDGRKISLSARSPVLLRQIKEWMKTTAINQSNSSYVPTRLLRIEDNGERVELSSPSHICVEYACLSHCWGLTQPLLLNSHTSTKLRKGVSKGNLPRSFQDAIWLTHQLGLQYLWIDSLCILQDNAEDWARESSHMDKVYQNATITIAASQASDSSKGFLDRNLPRVYTPTQITIGGIHGHALLFPIPLKFAGNPNLLAEMEEEPLTARGWVLQERYMARRTIHFTQDQLFLECEGNLLAEDSGFSISLPMQSPFTLSANTRENPAWTKVVERYSRRRLTREQDKLPALAGMAAYFSSISEDKTSNAGKRYLAGLWSTDIVKHLCWKMAYQDSPGARPTKYRAPTWSWASIDGPITFQEAFSKSLLLIQDTQTELKRSDNIFGEVISGWVFLKAIHLEPKEVSADGRSLGFSENGIRFLINADWDTKQNGTKEQLQQLMIQEKLTVVLVAWQETQEPLALAGPLCLILTPVEHRVHPYHTIPTYERVGSGIARTIGEERQHAKLSTSRLRAQYLPDDAATAYTRVSVNVTLAGNAFVCSWKHGGGIVCWVTQLVAHKEYREQGLAGGLLRSLRGDTDDIYGIMSSHPAACLAAAKCFGSTIEKVSMDFILKNAVSITEVSPIPYIKNTKLSGKLFDVKETNGLISGVNTDFLVDHEEPKEALALIREEWNWPLGDLPDGHKFLLILQGKSRRSRSRSLSRFGATTAASS
ncbi:hypothetical protein PG987_004257 [Apiospora arundinis]